MDSGMKFDGNSWLRLLDRMELHLTQPDRGYSTLQDYLEQGYTLVYGLWRETTASIRESCFVFVLRDKEGKDQQCEVVYGPKSAGYMLSSKKELYFREGPLERIVEVESGGIKEVAWRAGL